jgi:hypothetical protein
LAGLLWGGTSLAGTIALAISPFSLLGLIAYGIGALGFTPIFTSIAFGRNAAAAGRRARGVRGRSSLIFFGVVLAILIPLLVGPLLGPAIARALHAIPLPRGRFGEIGF